MCQRSKRLRRYEVLTRLVPRRTESSENADGSEGSTEDLTFTENGKSGVQTSWVGQQTIDGPDGKTQRLVAES